MQTGKSLHPFDYAISFIRYDLSLYGFTGIASERPRSLAEQQQNIEGDGTRISGPESIQ